MATLEENVDLHDTLVELLRNLPRRKLVELICAAAGISLDDIVEIHERTPIVEVPRLLRRPRKLRLDLVLMVHGKRMRVSLVAIIEVQLSWDPTKRRYWPLAALAFSNEENASALVAVFAPAAKLRRRLRERMLPKITPRPTLIEPDQIRLITDEAEAREHMFEAVLGAIYHGSEDLPVETKVAGIRAAYLALQQLEFAEYFRYAVLMASLTPPELFQEAVEELRARGVLEEDRRRRIPDSVRSSWLWHYVLSEADEKGLREGTEKGLREGIEKGLREGIERGLREGREQGQRQTSSVMQQALLDVLELRGFALTAEARARIDACEQFETLERWYAIARTGDPNTPIIDLLG